MQLHPATSEAGLEAALAALGRGELVAVPTETVYGLAADATNGRAIAGLYATKGRPSFNPLIAHVEDRSAAERHGIFDEAASRLAEAFWPGPLTLVVPKRPASPISHLATAGLDTVGLRVPAQEATRALIRRFGRPLAAPSANRSGRISPTSAADVVEEFGDGIAVILDGGPTPVGVESTILACVGGRVRLLRPGGVTREAIEAVLGCDVETETDGAPEVDPHRPLAPGMLASHYAPAARVRLDAVDVRAGEALLAFGADRPAGADGAVAVRNLSASGDLAEAAANLFRCLRELDRSGAAVIAVVPIPREGLGAAILDRLTRAAAPRGTRDDTPKG